MTPELRGIQVQAFFIADHAEAVRGKLYVTGGCWNVLNVASLPATHSHLSLAMTLRVPWPETNIEHAIGIDLLDEDGESALSNPVEGKFEVGRAPGVRPGDEILNVLVLNMEGLQLPREGMYTFKLTIDGSLLGEAQFRVRRTAQTAQTG